MILIQELGKQEEGEMLMERIHKTNIKVIKYPLINIRKGLQKRYGGNVTNSIELELKLVIGSGSYRSVEHLISRITNG